MKTLIDRAKDQVYLLLFAMLASAAFSNSLFEISSSVFMVLWLFTVLAERRWKIFKGVWVYFLGAYVAVNVLSVFQTVSVHDSVKGAFRVLRWAILTLGVTDTVDTREKLIKVCEALLAVVLFICLDALIQGMTGIEILRGRAMTAFYGETKRITGPFTHANDFSAYLCLALFTSCAGLITTFKNGPRSLRFFLALTVLLIAGVCFVMTYSRGAWLAAMLAFGLWALLRRSVWPVVLVGVFLLGAYLYSPFLFQKRFDSLGNMWSGTVSERRILWKESIEMIRARPVLGFGINTYSSNVKRFKDPLHPTDVQYAHNGYLQIAAETGLVGIGVFLTMIFYFLTAMFSVFFKRAGDAAKDGELLMYAQGLVLGIFAMLLQSATDTTLQSLMLSALLWMWIGLAWSAHRLAVVA